VFSKRSGEDIIYVMDLIANQNPNAGDYNEDGIVDAADYTVWRDKLGQPAGALPNDADGGVIDFDQYNTWRTNYGSGAVLSPVGAVTTPEPSSVTLSAVVLLASFTRRAKRRLA
jgi:hypothetical protein